MKVSRLFLNKYLHTSTFGIPPITRLNIGTKMIRRGGVEERERGGVGRGERERVLSLLMFHVTCCSPLTVGSSFCGYSQVYSQYKRACDPCPCTCTFVHVHGHGHGHVHGHVHVHGHGHVHVHVHVKCFYNVVKRINITFQPNLQIQTCLSLLPDRGREGDGGKKNLYVNTGQINNNYKFT